MGPQVNQTEWEMQRRIIREELLISRGRVSGGAMLMLVFERLAL